MRSQTHKMTAISMLLSLFLRMRAHDTSLFFDAIRGVADYLL